MATGPPRLKISKEMPTSDSIIFGLFAVCYPDTLAPGGLPFHQAACLPPFYNRQWSNAHNSSALIAERRSIQAFQMLPHCKSVARTKSSVVPLHIRTSPIWICLTIHHAGIFSGIQLLQSPSAFLRPISPERILRFNPIE